MKGIVKCEARDIRLLRCELTDIAIPRVVMEIYGEDYYITDWKVLSHFLSELTQEGPNGITTAELKYLAAYTPFRYLIEELIQDGMKLETQMALSYLSDEYTTANTIDGIIKNANTTNRWESFRRMCQKIMSGMPVQSWSNHNVFFNFHKIKMNNKGNVFTTYPVVSFQDEYKRNFIDIIILNKNRISIRGRYLLEEGIYVQPLPYRLARGPHTITQEDLKIHLEDYVAAMDNSWYMGGKMRGNIIESWSPDFSFHEINVYQHDIFRKFCEPKERINGSQ